MQIRVKILSNFSIFTEAKIVGLPEIIRFLRHLLTDVEKKRESFVTREIAWVRNRKEVD